MNIKDIIDDLTVVGAVLGTFAFFQNIIQGVVDANQEKWKCVLEIITLSDFHKFKKSVAALHISKDEVKKIKEFVHHIEINNIDMIGFKSIFSRGAKKQLANFVTLKNQLNKLVKQPVWDTVWNPYEGENTAYKARPGFYLKNIQNAEPIMSEEKAMQAFDENVEAVCKIAEAMEKNFSEIQRLVNKEPFEYFLPWKWRRK